MSVNRFKNWLFKRDPTYWELVSRMFIIISIVIFGTISLFAIVELLPMAIQVIFYACFVIFLISMFVASMIRGLI